ncbi:fimbrial protein [Serratia microhaemolytica]|uniref:fimbrial protein n=1 Tax=Serratia microhaemolytica TaxID=2675110 RepID=UPI000FDD9FAC|nr:fimbrial protein [Serratia microhaemolytica]
MAQYAKRQAAIVMASMLLSSNLWAAESAVVNFSAKIFDGTCQIQLSDNTLQFGLHKAMDFQPNGTVAILPLTATVNCSAATTPKLTITGTTPYTSNAIFRDADSLANGVGFMVRRDTGSIDLGSFYDEAAALNNNVPVALSPIGTADTAQDEPFLLGLVRSGTTTVTPGAIKATLTFTVAFD